jgi:hypothetical protein
MKTCAACKTAKPLDDFARQTKSKDGRHPYCKECTRARMKASYHARGKHSWVNDKICKWCNVLKPKTEFRTGEDGRVSARCLSCETEIAEREAEHLKRCNICREWLPHDKFQPSKLKYPNVACRSCTLAQIAQPDYKANRRAYTLQKEYGITAEQYDELVAKQGGKCPICLEPLPANRGGHVDHAHGGKYAGRIRGILHRDCNRFVMWTHEDSAQLRRAADLIDNPLTDWIVAEPTLNERRREKERQK